MRKSDSSRPGKRKPESGNTGPSGSRKPPFSGEESRRPRTRIPGPGSGRPPGGRPDSEERSADGMRKPRISGEEGRKPKPRIQSPSPGTGGGFSPGRRPAGSGEGSARPRPVGRPAGSTPPSGTDRPKRPKTGAGPGSLRQAFGKSEAFSRGEGRPGPKPKTGTGFRKPRPEGTASTTEKPEGRKPFTPGPNSRLGKQAPTQAKQFKRRGVSGEARPEYDERKITRPPATRRPRRNPAAPAEGKDMGSGEQLVRLNRYIAQSGLCSRREADSLISTGQITVNGKVVDQMGYLVKKDDVVKYGKRLLNREKLVYLLLNKPKDFITTTEDPDERKTVMNLVATACKERIYPVGRLDRNTTGLLLLTNDGELSEKLMHPSHNIKKIYQVDLDKPLSAADEAAIRAGVELEDGLAPVDELEVLSKDRDIVGLSIHLGRNRIVRRIFEHLGYKVVRLDRVMYAGLTKKDLPRGNWRFLTEREVINLKFFT